MEPDTDTGGEVSHSRDESGVSRRILPEMSWEYKTQLQCDG